jgi:hypothetical protein
MPAGEEGESEKIEEYRRMGGVKVLLSFISP